MKKVILLSLAIFLSALSARADLNDIFFDRPFFHNTDSLAPRDEWDFCIKAGQLCTKLISRRDTDGGRFIILKAAGS